MDPDVLALVRTARLLEAARLAGERGDARHASALFERACDWKSAAEQALRAGEPDRALELAAKAGDDALAERVIALAACDPNLADSIATTLEKRDQHYWAARILEEAGHARRAARAWERAHQPGRAAELLATLGQPGEAARVLEAALRREPTAWSEAVALGALLIRFGKDEAAVRVLQKVPEGARERRDALVHVVGALERLGLDRAASQAAAELVALGGTPAQQRPGLVANEQVERPSPILFGRYEVVEEVSSSPSARVVECIDRVRGERVAVKLFAAWDALGAGRDALARFEREMRALRALDHPSVVPLRDFVADAPAIVLAWMAGGTLERMLESGSIAPSRAVEIASSVLSALGEAHRHGILHRDVKPANVLFDSSGAARLSDFGAAHFGDASATATAAVFGTLAYMSPEQREGRPADARSDVFAVGVLLHQMLTGEVPDPSQPRRTRASDVHDELDERHDAVVLRMTAREADERPPDAFEARASLVGLPWPSSTGRTTARLHSSDPASRRSAARRLEAGPDGHEIDVWTGRPIERVPLSEIALARARAFAIADHPALQPVLRVDRDEATIWLGALSGHPLDGALSHGQRTRLEQALAALHRADGIHGSVDPVHVVVDEEAGVMLRFEPDQSATATMDSDRIALARLA